MFFKIQRSYLFFSILIFKSFLKIVQSDFVFLGVNESGAETGSVIPGENGVDYFMPSSSSLSYFSTRQFNTVISITP